MSNSIIKIIAILTMIIDHVGLAFYPDIIIFRIIGRISLPLFIFLLVNGFNYTNNKTKYLIRLFIFALISQVPYTLLFQNYKLNIFFTLYLCLLFLMEYEKKNSKLIIILFCIAAEQLRLDYGSAAILLSFFIYNKGNSLKLGYIISMVPFILKYGLNTYILQLFGLFSLIFINYYNRNIGFKINKYIFYTIYPIHIILILLIKHI